MDCLTAGIEYKKDYYEDGRYKTKESLFFKLTLCLLVKIVHQG